MPTLPPAPAPAPAAARPRADTRAPAEPWTLPRWTAGTLLATLAVGVLIDLGQALLVPLALAALLAFLLDPLVSRLRRLGLPRAPAVAVVVLGSLLVAAAAAVFVAGQVSALAKDLPTYQSTVQTKLRALRQQLAQRSDGFDATSRMLSAVGGELDAARRELAGGPRQAPPTPVTLAPESRSALQAVGDIATPLLGPLGTAGAVLLFLVLMLVERHDLRDRLLRLTGAELHRGAEALDEAAQRVSRYLTMQLLVNLAYGLPLGLGLWLLGVPGAPLWGLLGALLRFVPYLGPVVAAIFPLTLAFAVDPGWQLVLWTLALVVVLELVSNNIVEPWLYGASTGLSALAIVVSAMFWTLLWGPVGLVLATPLTVCLAVLGRHVRQLAWLDVLLGSGPVFDPATRLLQRLLAGDVDEAVELCEQQARSTGVVACIDGMALPALALAARAGTRPQAARQRQRVLQGLRQVHDSLREELPPPRAAAGPRASDAAQPSLLCVGARSEADRLAADLLAQALAHADLGAPAPGAPAATADDLALPLPDGTLVVVCSCSPAPQAPLRQIARRLKRRQPGLRIVAALWNAPAELLAGDACSALGVDAVAGTVDELIAQLRRLQPGLAPASAAAAAAALPGLADTTPATDPKAPPAAAGLATA